MHAQDAPLACLVDAIPEKQRTAHFARLSDLFGTQVQEIKKVPRGYAFRFEPESLDRLAQFVSRERLCCPFLTFTIAIASGGGPVWLEMTGPEGTREFLAGELPLPDHLRGQAERMGRAS
jgi:hypothetical protein